MVKHAWYVYKLAVEFVLVEGLTARPLQPLVKYVPPTPYDKVTNDQPLGDQRLSGALVLVGRRVSLRRRDFGAAASRNRLELCQSRELKRARFDGYHAVIGNTVVVHVATTWLPYSIRFNDAGALARAYDASQYDCGAALARRFGRFWDARAARLRSYPPT
jgi:hypothetical protein